MSFGGFMGIPSKKLVGFALIFIVAFSAYLTIVQIVNTFKPEGILKSFLVKSLRRPGSSGKFLMGDTLVVGAESDVASEYDLQVHFNSSLVFGSEWTGGSPLKAQVQLSPPAFTVGKSYTLSVNGFVLNSPIPGAYFADSASYTFDVASAETTLGLVSEHDDVTNGLYTCANLTDADGYPVANETVSFFLQLKSEHPLTDGWIPLGSRMTGSNGTAMLSMGFPLIAPMAVKACHEGNANFGPCKKTTDVAVTSNFTESFLYLRSETCNDERTCETGVLDNGTVRMSMSTSSPYALLPVTVTANYTSDSPLNGTYANIMMYYLDNVVSGSIGWSPLVLVPGGPPYVYQTAWAWPQGPNATGVHNLTGGVVAANDTTDITFAAHNGTGISASGNVTLNINACPSNVVLHFPEAVCGHILPLTVAFSKPRAYEANDGFGFAACSLAPQLAYDGVGYAIDEPVNASVPVSLYANGTLKRTNMTDANGLASFSLQLNASETHSNVSIRCVADGSALLFQSANIERNVSFTNVNVSDTMTGGSGGFKLNCMVEGQGFGNGTICVGAENPVDLSVRLSDSPVWAAPASVLIGKPLKRAYTNGSGWVSAASGSNLLRVASLFDISTTTAMYAAADIDHDGRVSGSDLALVSWSFGSWPGQPKWNWRADLNFNLKVDGTDVTLCSRSFGQSVNYTSVLDYSVVKADFQVNGQLNEAWLDRSGCVSVPAGASGLNFSLGSNAVGAVAEFFNCTFHQDCYTNNAGEGVASWVPPETGDCSIEAINSGLVKLKPYFALAWLPSSLQAVLSRWSNATSVHDPLSLATYLNVVKRPVVLSLTNSTFQCSVMLLNAVANTYADEAYPDWNFGYNSYFYVGCDLDYYQQMGQLRTELAYVRFDVSSIPANFYILSARLKLFPESAWGVSGGHLSMYRVASQWYEGSLTWANRPSAASEPSCIVSRTPSMSNYWFVWDVTSDVRMWYGGSSNCGHMISCPDVAFAESSFCTNHFSNPMYSCNNPVLEVTYVPLGVLPVNLTASLVDGTNGQPVSGASLGFSVSDGFSHNPQTDSDGTASVQWGGPSTDDAYEATASYSGNEVLDAPSVSVCLDFRTPTTLGLGLEDGAGARAIADGDTINVSTHEENRFLCWASPWAVGTRTVNVYLNGSLYGTPPILDNSTAFFWTADSLGVYYFNFTYGGSQYYTLSQVNFAAIAQASPVCLGFNVTPSEFKLGDSVTLWAKVVNPFSNQSLNGVTVEFWQNGTLTCVANPTTGLDGVATATWPYPTNSINTVVAKVAPNQGLANCTLVVRPVTLTVGAVTQLLLEAWRDPGGTGHTVYARLVDANGSGLQGYTVTLNVNGTAYTQQTNQSGYVTLHLALQPGDTTANMYQVLATFNGTNPRKANLTALDPYGDQYVVCTTMQYDLKPATNSSTMAVLLQSTYAFTAAKKPEQMQGETGQNGKLRIWHRRKLVIAVLYNAYKCNNE